MIIKPININFSFLNNIFYFSDFLSNDEDISIPINNFILLLCNRSLDELNKIYKMNRELFEEYRDKLYIISSINCYLEGLIWLNNKFKFTNDEIINITDNILKNKKINTYKFILNLIDNGFIYDQKLTKLAIIHNNIKLLEYCYNNFNNDNIIQILIDYPNIDIIKWFINKNILDIPDFTLYMIRNKNYDIIKWLYHNKYIFDKYIINKAILFNDILLLNFIFIESGYIHFQDEFIINQILYKKKLKILDWFLSKNIYFNTDCLFRLAFNKYTNYLDMNLIIHMCHKHKINFFDKNNLLKLLENQAIDNNETNDIIKTNKINNINLDKIYWRYYLFNLNQNDLLDCNILNNKIIDKKNELENYKNILYKTKLPNDIIKYHIIPYL